MSARKRGAGDRVRRGKARGPRSEPSVDRDGRALGTAAWIGCLVFAVAVVWGMLYLFLPERLLDFPTWFWPLHQPWWWPFRPQSFVWRPGVLTIALAATSLLVGISAFPEKLGLRATLGVIVLGSLLLRGAIMALPEGGLATYARFVAATAHSEFFVRAAINPHLLDTLVAYEDHLHDGLPETFSRAKGPANLGYHVVLHRIAQLPGVRHLLQRSVAEDVSLSFEVIRVVRRRFGMLPGFTLDLGKQMVPALLLSPLVSWAIGGLLPLFGFVLARALFAARDTAVRAAVLAGAVPAIVLENTLLDGSIFPLLFVSGLAAFMYGWQQQRRAFIALAGLVGTTYVYFTFAGVALVALCAAVAALDLVVPPRRAGRLSDAAVYAAAVAGSLLVLRLVLTFHVVDRYVDALSLQATWRGVGEGVPPNWRWVLLNSCEFFLTSGPVLTALSLMGTGVALYALRAATIADKFALAVAAVFLLSAILGRNSEVYRLWAFWGLAFIGPALLALRAVGPDWQRAAGVVAVGSHLLWLLLLATRFGHLP